MADFNSITERFIERQGGIDLLARERGRRLRGAEGTVVVVEDSEHLVEIELLLTSLLVNAGVPAQWVNVPWGEIWQEPGATWKSAEILKKKLVEARSGMDTGDDLPMLQVMGLVGTEVLPGAVASGSLAHALNVGFYNQPSFRKLAGIAPLFVIDQAAYQLGMVALNKIGEVIWRVDRIGVQLID